MKHIILGAKGEIKAQKYLKSIRYKILETNHKNLLGEIDIVAKDKTCIVFVEVKTRSSVAFGTGAYAVNAHKQHKLKQAASVYLKQNNLLDYECRFDVIDILDDKINHIKNAF